jgi:VIT family
MATNERRSLPRVLDPIDRVSEILFGLIMVLTSTGTLSVLTAGDAEIRTMIVGALGCNLAWGIIDGGLYLMACLEERARGTLLLRAVKHSSDPANAKTAILDSLPQPVAATLTEDQLEMMRRSVLGLPETSAQRGLAKDDWLGALAICLLVFLSTFPVVIPFLVIDDVRLALRFSNVIAIVLLFLCGYVFAQNTGLRPWLTGFAMILVGCALVGIAIALGG